MAALSPIAGIFTARVRFLAALAVLGLAGLAGDQPAYGEPPGAVSQWRARVRRELAAIKPPPPPPAAGNPVDAFLEAWWKEQGVAPPPVCGDRTFLRRVYLDLIGLLPDERQQNDFLSDRRADKRERLIGELLAQKRPYAEHWMTFWNDLLRNEEITLIEVNRNPITNWLYQALLENKPYDEFAAELIAPALNGPAGFIQGIEWKFATSASEAPPMQAARSVAQVFQGVNLKCASCHDSFEGPRKLEEAWNLAACFAPGPLQMQRCDLATGKTATPRFLFAEAGAVPADAPLEMRREAVAVLVTRPANPRFARVIVNRLFRQHFGEAIVASVDDFDGQRGFAPELLDYLAYDLAKHDYDLKRTLRLLATSQAYQRETRRAIERQVNERRAGGVSPPLVPAKRAGAADTQRHGDSPIFAHRAQQTPQAGKPQSIHKLTAQKLGQSPVPRRKRMTAEQFSDAVASLTGYWPQPTLMQVEPGDGPVRAWRYRDPNTLATALGRPSRDVINSVRAEEATVLQALELINGDVLQQRLTKGAESLLAGPLGKEPDIDNVVHTLCRRAYCRDASAAELEHGRALLGTPQQRPAQRRAGWEDFLWLTVMRSEFQYID